MEIIFFFLALIIAASAVALIYELRDAKKRLNEHDRRIAKLEASNRLRMPQDAQEKILNAMAAIVNLKGEGKVIDDLVANAEEWMKSTLAIGTKRE